jgi:hypothetical protein
MGVTPSVMFNSYSALAVVVSNIVTRPATITEQRLAILLKIIINSLEHMPAFYE